ncbi:MAG TPA: serine/threonine-protein kinase [Polyangiaceae bacterium]
MAASVGLTAVVTRTAWLPALGLVVCGLCSLALMLLGGDPAPAPAQALPSEPPAATDTPSGLAAYELVELLGSGSMGELWLAKHKLLGRIAALKRIKAEVVQAEDVARFKREARATSELTSPHTVEVYDFGDDGGVLFYAMECLDGVDLQKLVSLDGPMPPARAIAILVQACHSLAEAHALGIVHRDIKPANLMLCRYGLDLDFVKLLDFGLAKAAQREPHESALTRDGIVLGTAAYLAPESLSGSAHVDGRADIYALGAVAFWLIAGRLVFEHDKPMAMVKAHLQDMPPRASAVSRFKVPPAFDQLIADCLEKDPAKRPQTASELAERLADIQLDERWTKQQASSWWQATKLAPARAQRT